MNNRVLSLLACTLCIFARPIAAAEFGKADFGPASARTTEATDGLAATDLLHRAQSANQNLYTSLQSFVCDETVLRFRGSDNINKTRQLDTVTAKVSFENGSEHYTNIQQNANVRSSLSSVPGAWSEGEFGTLLHQTQQLLRVEPATFQSAAQLNGSPVAVYTFDVSEVDSPWDLAVDGRIYRLPFRTEMWVSKLTGEILRVGRRSSRVPPEIHISAIEWSVSLAPVNLNGASWLLPATGEYSVLYTAQNRREWNHLSFSNYHRYGSEAALRFDPVK